MLELFFALFLALSCPMHNSQYNDNGTAQTQNSGGDKEHLPPPPPPPPGSGA